MKFVCEEKKLCVMETIQISDWHWTNDYDVLGNFLLSGIWKYKT